MLHFYNNYVLLRKKCTFRTLPADPYRSNDLIGLFDLKSTQNAFWGENLTFYVKSAKSVKLCEILTF